MVFLWDLYLDHYSSFFYINEIPKIIKINSKPVLFEDDTSLIITIKF